MMRTELPVTAAGAMAEVGSTPTSRRRLNDVVCAALLVMLPAAVFGVPALLGHAVLPGDDITQNFPLRVLAGQQIRAGHLPLYDPYIWSGAQLLAGWNAAAAYPFTWLFAIMPGTAAWTVNLIVTWAVAGLGMFCFLRALRLASLASFLGALSFAFGGAMAAQVTHFGLIAGMSWVPVELLAILRLSQDRPAASRLRWTAVLAAATGLTILAGEPRAVDDACVIDAIYAAWQIVRLGRRSGPAAISVTAGLVLGACLGAVQWLPGLAAISTSQRGAASMSLFTSGSLPVKWLLLTLVPDLLGGSGSLGQPSFFAGYNLTEVTSYVGILPLVAAFALLGRLRLRQRPPEWLVWHLMALAGIVLALGGNTPLGSLLYHLPLFGDQRLQSRNILVLDLALAVLFGYWADQPFRGGRVLRNRVLRYRPFHRIAPETMLGVLPALAAIVVVAGGLTWGTGLLHWLGATPSRSASVIGHLKPWLVPYAVLSAGAIALVIFGRRLGPRLRACLCAGFVVADLVVFTVLGVVDVPSSHPGTDRTAAPTAAPHSIATLGYSGRFAIYDPDLIDSGELSALGPPDLNGISAVPSVQGYSSIVDGTYAAGTGAHRASGEGQDVLSPAAVGNGTLDQLDTSVLLTLPAYLITAAGDGGPAPGLTGTGRHDLAAGQRATWYLGTPLEVSKVEVPDPDAQLDAAAGMQIGLTTPGGSTRWFRARAVTASTVAISLSRPVASIAVVGWAQGAPARLGAPSIAEPGGQVFVADGQLQSALVPPRWGFAGFDGSFAVFTDHFATGPLSIQALPGRSASGASIKNVKGAPDEPTAATVSSPHGVRVVRSVAAIPGWSATWQPLHGQTTTLTVQRDGLIQAVDVPAGQGVVTWSYMSPGFPDGLALSLAAGLLVLLLMVTANGGHLRTALAGWRPRRRDGGFGDGIPSPGESPSAESSLQGEDMQVLTGSHFPDTANPRLRPTIRAHAPRTVPKAPISHLDSDGRLVWNCPVPPRAVMAWPSSVARRVETAMVAVRTSTSSDQISRRDEIRSRKRLAPVPGRRARRRRAAKSTLYSSSSRGRLRRQSPRVMAHSSTGMPSFFSGMPSVANAGAIWATGVVQLTRTAALSNVTATRIDWI
jgi:hypothetical protein